MSQQLNALLLCVLLCCSALAAPTNNSLEPESRILGGNEAAADATPYAASLRVDSAHVCSATIVAPTKLLTVAHCIYRNNELISPSRITARVGSTNQYSGGKIVAIAAVQPHPDYFETNNNLAVLTLSAPLAYTARIQPIELASDDDDLPPVNTAVSVAGWGRTIEGTASYKIRQLSLKLADDDTCKDAHSDINELGFCLAHELKEGTCYGDGGSGAVYNNKMIGMVNFAVGACGSRYPDVFVRISQYYDWLQDQLES